MTRVTKKKIRSQHQATGQWIRADKRLAIYLRDDFRCVYCLTDLRRADSSDITLDHIRPKADGGSNSEANLVTCCRSCNCSRQDKPLSRWVGSETIKHVRRNTRRSLKKYRALAKDILSGDFNFTDQNR